MRIKASKQPLNRPVPPWVGFPQGPVHPAGPPFLGDRIMVLFLCNSAPLIRFDGISFCDGLVGIRIFRVSNDPGTLLPDGKKRCPSKLSDKAK